MKLSRDQLTLPLSFALAAWYWLNCETGSRDAMIAKVASTAALAVHGRNTPLASSLIVHCVGDFLIELPGDAFLAALAAFFAGHAFCARSLHKDHIPPTLFRTLMMGTVGMFNIKFSQLLTTQTSGVIQYIIPIYSAMLSAMFMMACLQKNPLRTIGAAAYLASDIAIGANMFLQKIPGIGYFTWAAYFIGQWLMLMTYSGVSQTPENHNNGNYLMAKK